jgi:stringent starvation protein B
MQEVANMSSSRPYLIRAMYEWIVDNGLTPYLLVDAQQESVEVPTEFVEDGKIVLNVSPTAVEHLDLGNDWISFQARFAGSPRQLHVPASATLAIYARENGQGMMFGDAEAASETATEPAVRAKPDARSHLKVVK